MIQSLRQLLLVTTLLAAASLAVSCSGDGGPIGDRCTPGSQVTCECIDGRMGTALCDINHVPQACVCSPDDPDAGDGGDADDTGDTGDTGDVTNEPQ